MALFLRPEPPPPPSLAPAESLQARNLRLFHELVIEKLTGALRHGALGQGIVRLTNLYALDTRLFCTFEVTHFPKRPWAFRTNLQFHHNLLTRHTDVWTDDLGTLHFHLMNLDKPIILMRSKALGVDWTMETADLRAAVAAFDRLPADRRCAPEGALHLADAHCLARQFVGTWYVRGNSGDVRTVRIVDDFLHLLRGAEVVGCEYIPNWQLHPDGHYEIGMILEPHTGRIVFTDRGEWWSREPVD